MSKLLKVIGLGKGDIAADRSGIELGLTLEDGTEARLLVRKDILERLIYAFQSLMTKLTQLNPRRAVVGETVTVIAIDADEALVATMDDGRIAIRFESAKSGMCPTVAMSAEQAKNLQGLLSEWIKTPKGKSTSSH